MSLLLHAHAAAAAAATCQELFDAYNSRMAAKLGLKSFDQTLSKELLTLMVQSEADFTNTFRCGLSLVLTTHSSCYVYTQHIHVLLHFIGPA